jgi:pimeloyl-ACP methyl ester carboxylesterase
MPQTDTEIFYQLYFQTEGVAEKEFEQDIRRTLRIMLGMRPSKDTLQINPMVPKKGGWLTSRALPSSLPEWLTEKDIDFYASEFEKTGFRGGLNWYRNIDRNWAIRSPWAGAKIVVPALYIAGEHDLVLKFAGVEQLIANLKLFVPQLQKAVILPDCGHWTQQEKAAEVNSLLIEFLSGLKLS